VIRLAKGFAKAIWDLRDLIPIVALLMVLGVVAWIWGADWFEHRFAVSKLPQYQHGERAALAVSFMCGGAAVLFLLNAFKVLFTGKLLDITIPDSFKPVLTAAVPIAVGILIGTTIFT
jgi:hypothetical protein